MILTIRAANPDDIAEIQRVNIASIRILCASAYTASEIAMLISLSDPVRFSQQFAAGSKFLVAVKQGCVCGTGAVNPDKSLLASLFVDPGHAGSGIGSALLSELESLASVAGIRMLKVNASLNARNFYQKHGYETCGEGQHRFSTGERINCVFMQKQLVP